MLILNMNECEANCRRCEMQNDRATEKLIICRDFLRNLCKRGDQCKYFHPQRDDGKEVYVFCHDFQNGGCTRLGCRFIHCSAEDEEYYNKTGELLPHVFDAYRKIMETLDESGPVCKDYFKGKCKRDSCKFRHLPEEKPYETDRPKPVAVKSNNRQPEDRCCQIQYEPKIYRNEYEDYSCECKRRRIHNYNHDLNMRNYENPDNRKLWVLESENEMLRQRLSEITKKNSDLQATNEFLLEQNARLRIGEQGTPSLTAVTVPAVTITNTGTLPQGQVSMQQPQVLRTMAASVATVPVSLAAVTATPVSLAAVSVAPMQIPPVCTVAHTPNGTTLTATIQQESQLVSYPILNRPTIIQGALQHH